MKRPLLLFTISLAVGIMLSYFMDSPIFSAITAILFSMAILCLRKAYSIKTYLIVGLIFFYSLGAFEYAFIAKGNEGRLVAFSEKEVTMRGHVGDEPSIDQDRISYLINVSEIRANDSFKKIKGKVLVSTTATEDFLTFKYGQSLEIRGVIKIPQEKRNPGGFDYRRYLASAGISATMFARSDNLTRLDSNEYNPVVRMGLKIRQSIISLVDKLLPQEQAGLLNGMMIGYRDGLSDDVQAAFSDAGLTHIMAVSGANIAFIIFPLAFLFKKLRFRQFWANTMVILLLILFVCVTGFSPSVVRAVIMAITILLAQIIRRDTDVYTSIALAAMLLLIYNPYVLFDIGFQLSFGATISLVLFYGVIKEKLVAKHVPAFFADLIAVTTAAQVGVLPLTAFYFNKISIISLVSNIFVVPLTGIITILGFVMTILGQFSLMLAQGVGFVNNTLLTVILYVTKISAGLPFAVLKVITPHIAIILLYYLAIMFLFWYKPQYMPSLKLKPQYYALIAASLIAVFSIYSLIPGKLEVVFIDVGQGDSAFIRSSTGKTVLLDGGGSDYKADDDNNIGETTVIPFLLDYGVSSLDTVIATHGHNDHIQGLIPILKNMKVGKLVVPALTDETELRKIIELAKSRNIPVYRCTRGDFIRLDDNTGFDVIHPQKNEIEESYSNNNCLVLKLHYKNISVLFTGDIEGEAESALVNSGVTLKSDMIKIPHHGSPYSTTEDFLEKVAPRGAVISVGKNNFGHPAEEVLDRLASKDIKIFRTDLNGAIVLKSNGRKITAKKTIGD